MDTKYLIANWKANKTLREAQQWVQTFVQQERKARQYVVCPPFPFISHLAETGRGIFSVGAQDMSQYAAGPYTGEVSPYNLQDLGVKYVILGHSERRKFFGETSAQVAQKVEQALSGGFTPIVCIDRNEFQAQADQIDRSYYSRMIIAYEPVHAISTFGGQEDPIETTVETVMQLQEIFDEAPVLYGGSADSQNSLIYLQQPAISGLLVGKASLDPLEFSKM